jgi:hypothetical protein
MRWEESSSGKKGAALLHGLAAVIESEPHFARYWKYQLTKECKTSRKLFLLERQIRLLALCREM